MPDFDPPLNLRRPLLVMQPQVFPIEYSCWWCGLVQPRPELFRHYKNKYRCKNENTAACELRQACM